MKKNKLHINKNTGFKSPDQYFEGLEDKIMSEINLNQVEETGFKTPDNYFDNLEDLILPQAKMSHIEKPGFKTPNQYFETIEDSIIDKLEIENKSVKVISIFSKKNLIYISGVAAAILLLLNLSIFKETTAEDPFDSLDSGLVESYIINEDISSLEIASLLPKGELIEENFIDYNISEEHIENYLLDNIDIEDIMLE